MQPDGVLCFAGGMECVPVASAILMMYTSQGFLIAADGRARLDKKVLSDTTQKIFPIQEPGRSLAYAFSGMVAFTDKDDSAVILMDLRDEALKAIKSLRMSRHNGLASYAKKFADRLRDATAETQRSGRIEPFADGDSENVPGFIACLFFAGHYESKPAWLTVQFIQQNQVILPPLINVLALRKGYEPGVTYGSKEVGDRVFFTDDPLFARYRVPKPHIPEEVTLVEAADVARNYIVACSDPEAMRIDPEHCAGIGGHIHMATVTPKQGFEWLTPPRIV